MASKWKSIKLYSRSNTRLLLLLCMAFFVCILGVSIGSSFIPPLEIIKQLLGQPSGEHAFTIEVLRLPRISLAFLAGMALAVSGLILQGIVRNPLASPDIIGITGGGSVAAVLFLTFFSGVSLNLLPFVSITGSAINCALIYVLSWQKGITPVRLVLIGIGIQAAMASIISMLMVISPSYSTSEAYIWLTGSVYGANWQDVQGLLPWVVIFIPLAAYNAKQIDIQEIGEDYARALGLKVQTSRLMLIVISVALAGSAVSFAGGIGFVGLIAPHIARKLIGRPHFKLIPATALIGGIIVVLADIVARTAFLPKDLPAGVFVSGIGAIFFIYLLYKNKL